MRFHLEEWEKRWARRFRTPSRAATRRTPRDFNALWPEESLTSVKSSLSTVTDAIESFDKDVGIKDTLGGLVLAGTDLASQLASKEPHELEHRTVFCQVVELNDQYKASKGSGAHFTAGR